MPRYRLNRRNFLAGSLAALSVPAVSRAPMVSRPRGFPCIVASHNAVGQPLDKAMELLNAGEPVADAVVEAVRYVENDPNDVTVGLGGLPNEDGVVELDASVMDGASGLSGAVAALQRIRNPASVALRVMRYTDHCLLVGEGARKFARAHGFEEQDLLTEKSRRIWLYWKSTLSNEDKWLPEDKATLPEDVRKFFGLTGTVNCCAVDKNGNFAGTTSTSGLAFKLPGRVGDSPIIGAGLYVDNDTGAAGSTGRGEANIITCGSLTVVEAMARGDHPKDACLHAAKRIVRMTKAARLLKDGRPSFNVVFYAVDKKGQHGSAAIHSGAKYAVFDGKGNRLEDSAAVFE